MPIYDFTRLSSADFEELIGDLLGSAWKTRLEVFAKGRDSGIDLRAFANSSRQTIIQCKHFARSGVSKLISHLERIELTKIKKLSPQRYVLATSLRDCIKINASIEVILVLACAAAGCSSNRGGSRRT
jgi:hypothetical protein